MSRRRTVEFGLRVLFATVLALGFAGSPASANPKYAGMVVDGHSGKMLYGENIDSPRYPASITKVMTLYIVFEELRAGRLEKSTKMKVSKYASGQAPSKLGLKPGQTITVDEAIRALVTKSANDVAVVIAEHIGGTEKAFAKRMTDTAHRMGMSRTTFRNPHGLPNSAQKTTARDLIKLSLRIQRDFPDHYEYFKTTSFTWRGRTFRNHNKLLGRFQGTTGIKTGYIRASGYNLSASVDRGNKRIVAVVMGGRTGRSRDAHMRKIIERAWPQAVAYSGRPPVDAPPPARKPELVVAAAPEEAIDLAPSPRKVRNEDAAKPGAVLTLRIARMPPRDRELPLAEPVSRRLVPPFAVAGMSSTPAIRARATSPSGPVSLPAMAAGYAPAEASAPLGSIGDLIRSDDGARNTAGGGIGSRAPESVGPARRAAKMILPPTSMVGRGSERKTAATPATARATAPAAAPASGRSPSEPKPETETASVPEGYQIQVGAYARKQNAEERIEDARKAATRLLSEAMGIAMLAQNENGRFYRARFAGLDRQNANQACRELKRKSIACIVVAR